jgi:hypothetical protein
MSVQICPNCGTPRESPHNPTCKACGLSFASWELSIATNKSHSVMTNAQSQATTITVFVILLAIGSAYEMQQFAFWSPYYALQSYLTPFAITATFWYSILRFPHAQLLRVYLEAVVLNILCFVMPFVLLLGVLSLQSAQGRTLQASKITSTTISDLLVVAIGSLIGIGLARIFVAWDAIHPSSTTRPRASVIRIVYGAFLACLALELALLYMLYQKEWELAGIYFILGQYLITGFTIIVYPIIGRKMALRALT